MLYKKTFAFLMILSLLSAPGCGDKIGPGTTQNRISKTVKADIAVAKIHNQPFIYEAVGNVEARTASTISGKLMGTVTAIHVREGDMVQKGDLLVELDDRQVTAQLQQAEAGLAEAKRGLASARSALDSAKAGTKLAGTTYARYQKLYQDESISRQEFDEIEAKNKQADASLAQAKSLADAANQRVKQAEAAVESARVSKKDARVLAPYKGKVTARIVDVGDLASPGTPFLTLEKEGLFCVSLVVPEEHIASVSLGLKVNVSIPSMNEELFTGTIGRIDPTADSKSRSFKLKVGLPEYREFRSGLFARVSIPVGKSGIILLPTDAVVYRGQLTGYYLVDKDNIARFRLMRLGKSFGSDVEVISGLKSGDRYVKNIPPDMEDGVKVEVGS